MTMRTRISALGLGVCAAALALAAPVQARENDSRDSDAADVSARLSDPRNQIAVTAMLTALSEAVLDMRLDPFVRAMRTVDPGAAGDLPPDARVRDIGGERARTLPGEIGRNVPRAMGAASGMAGAVGDMLPQLREMGERVRESIPRY